MDKPNTLIRTNGLLMIVFSILGMLSLIAGHLGWPLPSWVPGWVSNIGGLGSGWNGLAWISLIGAIGLLVGPMFAKKNQ